MGRPQAVAARAVDAEVLDAVVGLVTVDVIELDGDAPSRASATV